MKERRKKHGQRATRAKAKSSRPPRAQRDAQGRAHLVVHRDHHGRPVQIALEGPLFELPWQNEVAMAAATTTHAALASGRTVENAAELGRQAMLGTSKLVEGAIAVTQERPACGAGCSHCCYQSVGVSVPEVLAIYGHLQQTRSPPELDAVRQRICAADEKTRGMTASARFSPEHPCPFLVEGSCSIYEVRPLACRGMNSLDAEACERNLRDPEARARFLTGDTPVPCLLQPIRAFHAVAAGLQLALHDLHGLEVQPLELTAAMRLLFEDPQSLPQRWLAGQDPFQAARGGDSTHDPRSRALSGVLRG